MVRQVALPCLTGPFDILWKVKYSDTTLPDRSEAQAWLLTFRAWIRTQSFLPQLSPLDHVKRGSVNLKKKKKHEIIPCGQLRGEEQREYSL